MCIWHDYNFSCLVAGAGRLASRGLVCTCHSKLAVKLCYRLVNYLCMPPQTHTSTVIYVKAPHHTPSPFSFSLSLHPFLSSSIIPPFPPSPPPFSPSLFPDYLSSSVPPSITFGFNDIQVCFEVTINEDIVDETTESLSFIIITPIPTDVSIAVNMSTITILDNDGKLLQLHQILCNNI